MSLRTGTTPRFALGDIQLKADNLRDTLSDTQRDRLCDRTIQPSADWIKDPNYSPDRAEEIPTRHGLTYGKLRLELPILVTARAKDTYTIDWGDHEHPVTSQMNRLD